LDLATATRSGNVWIQDHFIWGEHPIAAVWISHLPSSAEKQNSIFKWRVSRRPTGGAEEGLELNRKAKTHEYRNPKSEAELATSNVT